MTSQISHGRLNERSSNMTESSKHTGIYTAARDLTIETNTTVACGHRLPDDERAQCSVCF